MEFNPRPEMFQALNTFLTEYQLHIGGFLGFTILTCLLVMIINITKLGVSGSNEKERASAIKNLLISGIGLAVLGSISTFYLLFIFSFFGNPIRSQAPEKPPGELETHLSYFIPNQEHLPIDPFSIG